MKERTRQRDVRLNVAKKMPPLKRKAIGGEYSVQGDRVLDWVKCNTDLAAYLVDLLREIGYIKFDPETRAWRGVDYEA